MTATTKTTTHKIPATAPTTIAGDIGGGSVVDVLVCGFVVGKDSGVVVSGIDRRGVEVGEGLGGSEVCLGGSEVIWGSVVMVAVVVGVGGLEDEGVWVT